MIRLLREHPLVTLIQPTAAWQRHYLIKNYGKIARNRQNRTVLTFSKASLPQQRSSYSLYETITEENYPYRKKAVTLISFYEPLERAKKREKNEESKPKKFSIHITLSQRVFELKFYFKRKKIILF